MPKPGNVMNNVIMSNNRFVSETIKDIFPLDMTEVMSR